MIPHPPFQSQQPALTLSGIKAHFEILSMELMLWLETVCRNGQMEE